MSSRPPSKEEQLREKLLLLSREAVARAVHLHIAVRQLGERQEQLYVVIFNRAAAHAMATRLSEFIKRPLRWEHMYWTFSEDDADRILESGNEPAVGTLSDRPSIRPALGVLELAVYLR